MLRSVLVASVALALVAPSGFAFHVPGVTVLDEVQFTTEKYVAWRVLVPAGGFVGVHQELDGTHTTFAAFGLWFIDAATMEFSALLSPAWYEEGGTTAHVSLAGGDLPGLAPPETNWPGAWISVDFEPIETKEWLIVATSGFDGPTQGHFKLTGLDGTMLLGRSEGDAFLHTERDFEGVVNTDARTKLPVRELTAEARVAYSASVEERVEHSLFASYWGGNHLDFQDDGGPDLQAISYDGPTGTHGGRDWYYMPGDAPGDYTFRIDRNVDWHDNTPVCRAIYGEPCWRIPLWVAGADVALPQ